MKTLQMLLIITAIIKSMNSADDLAEQSSMTQPRRKRDSQLRRSKHHEDVNESTSRNDKKDKSKKDKSVKQRTSSKSKVEPPAVQKRNFFIRSENAKWIAGGLIVLSIIITAVICCCCRCCLCCLC